MTKLRKRMWEDMRIRNLSLTTQKKYLAQVAAFANHFHKSPQLLGIEDIRVFLLYLAREKKFSSSSINVTVSALRFLYKVTLGCKWDIEKIHFARREKKLPVVLSPEEVAQFLKAVKSRKHQVILMTSYATGLRILEATRLKISDIDTRRMAIRVQQGKGKRDRYVMLSRKLLLILREYWKKYRPSSWLFYGETKNSPLSPGTVRQVCRLASFESGLKKRVTPHILRHSFATYLLEQGVNLRTIQILLGHKSPKSTTVYTHIAVQNLKATTSPFDTLPGL
ncbi:MAG: tyrosine-type recombinase/integrase [Candidatus Aminicenantaceae bacterium]